jgi:hypothetical protein
MRAVVVTLGIGERGIAADAHRRLHAVFGRRGERKQAVREHPRLCAFTHFHVDQDLLHPGRVG